MLLTQTFRPSPLRQVSFLSNFSTERFFSCSSGQVLVTGQCGATERPLPWGSHAHCPLKAWGLGGTQRSIPTLPFLLVCVVWILGKSLDGMMHWQLFTLVVLGWE